MIKWTTDSMIGKPGGFGQVYKSRKIIDGVIQSEEYAKKVLMVKDNDSIERFKKEVRLCKRLNHPNVVEIIDENLYLEPYYYIMNLYDCSMDTIIKDIKTDYERLRKIFNSIFDGVEYLHSQGTYHRDLKPENILMNSNDQLVLADLGLGIQLSSNSERLTRTGAYMGTPFYMSPEQMINAKNIDERTDIYSLGCIIYQSLVEDFNYILDYSKIPASFEYVVRKATAENKEERFDSIASLRKAFTSAIDMANEDFDKNFGMEIIAKLNSGISDVRFISKVSKYISENSEDVDYIHDLVMAFNVKQFKILECNHLETTKSLIKQFKINIINQSWGFDYTDVIGRQCYNLIQIAEDKEIITDLIVVLVQVGVFHNRWYVMDLAREALYNVDDPVLSFMLSEELEEFQWEISNLQLDTKKLITPLKRFCEHD